MANEVSFGYATGKTLTYGVYTSAGSEKESGSSLTETPASSGLYLGTPTDIDASDYVIVKEGTEVVGFGQYKPEVSATGIEGKIDTIDTNVDTVLVELKRAETVIDESEPTKEVVVLKNL